MMASKCAILLLVVTLCPALMAMTAEEQEIAEEALHRNAQKTIMNNVIGTDLEESHIDGMADEDDMPKAYEKIIEQLLKTARECNVEDPYRRADGVCNNLKMPLWGASLHYQTRLFNDERIKEVIGVPMPSNAYMDHKQIPRMTGKYGFYLPNARDISVKCFHENQETKDFFDPTASQVSMQWGQYIDHDIVHTQPKTAGNCCNDPHHTCIHPDTYSGGPCFPIGIDEGDRYFNRTCMNFKRSFTVEVDGVHEQVSGITSYVDASTVYGSHKEFQDSLRTFAGGELLVDAHQMLPRHGEFKCRKDVTEQQCPTAGDARVNVFAGLTATHLIFVREHNRIAKKLQAINPHWDDEKIFQETRKIIIGLHQTITYDEYLPPILGNPTMQYFGLTFGHYKYDEDINPGVINEFAVAAFRFGHSQINKFIHTTHKNTPISETFFSPDQTLQSEERVKAVMKSQCERHAQKVDTHFTKELTDKLFLNVDAKGHSTDLVARNVQRGRDHGVHDYSKYFMLAMRDFYWPLAEKHNFTEADWTPSLPQCLTQDLYTDLNDIDLFVGGLSEQHIPGGMVGPTFAYILAEQFRRLKDGDRFFYENTDSKIGFNKDQIAAIYKQKFSHVICRNTEIDVIQPDVFHVSGPAMNAKKSCDKYEDINLELWRETPSVS